MSVGPTRGPVQRPDLDRDLTEIFQRITDLERARQGSPDPNFTATLQLGTSPSGDILFTSVDFVGSAHTVANGFAAFDLVGTWTVGANAPLVVTVTNYGAEADFAIGACNVQTVGAATREVLHGGVVLIPNGFTSLLKLDTHDAASVVMDLTTPTSPKFINAGTYAVTVTLNWLAL